MVIAAPVMAATTNLAASSSVTVVGASSSMVVHNPLASARDQRDLEAEFDYWASESLEWAKLTFEAQAEAVRES